MIMSMLLKNYNLYKNYVSLKCYSNSQSRGGRYGKNIYYYFRNFTILCHVDFTILSEQCSQNNFPITKTNPFKVTKYEKVLVDITTKVGEDKNLSLIYLCY